MDGCSIGSQGLLGDVGPVLALECHSSAGSLGLLLEYVEKRPVSGVHLLDRLHNLARMDVIQDLVVGAEQAGVVGQLASFLELTTELVIVWELGEASCDEVVRVWAIG